MTLPCKFMETRFRVSLKLTIFSAAEGNSFLASAGRDTAGGHSGRAERHS